MPGKRTRSGTAGGLSIEAGADELYGLPLDRFIAARTELVKAAKAAHDPETAAGLARLAKPNSVAWLANQLVRAHRDEVDELLEVGATLRAATAALDAARLRELTAQQRRKTAELVRRAKQLGASAGQTVSEATARGLEDTLHAALADADAADALVAGRLTAGLENSGFPGIEFTAAAAAVPKKAAKPPRPIGGGVAAPEPRELQRADDDLAAARSDHEQTAAMRGHAQQTADSAAADAEAAALEVERLAAELDGARQAQRTADKAHRQAVRALADADRALRNSNARLDRATARRTDLVAEKKR